jgi:hypothetical protein
VLGTLLNPGLIALVWNGNSGRVQAWEWEELRHEQRDVSHRGRANNTLFSGQDDPTGDEHLLLCPVCQDGIQHLDLEIVELKAAIRAFGPRERRDGPQLECRKSVAAHL